MRRPNVVLLMSMSPRKKLGVFVRLNASPLSFEAVAVGQADPLRQRQVDAELRRAVEGEDRQIADLAGRRVEEHLAGESGGVRQVVGADGSPVRTDRPSGRSSRSFRQPLWMPSRFLISSTDRVLNAVLQEIGSRSWSGRRG